MYTWWFIPGFSKYKVYLQICKYGKSTIYIVKWCKFTSKTHTNNVCKSRHSSNSLDVLSKKIGYGSSLHNRIKCSSKPSKITNIIHNLTHYSYTIGDNKDQHHQQLLLSPVVGDIKVTQSEARKLPTFSHWTDQKITVL